MQLTNETILGTDGWYQGYTILSEGSPVEVMDIACFGWFDYSKNDYTVASSGFAVGTLPIPQSQYLLNVLGK